MNELEDALARAQQERARLERELDEAPGQAELKALAEELAALQAETAKLTAEGDRLDDELAPLRQERDRLLAALADS